MTTLILIVILVGFALGELLWRQGEKLDAKTA